MGFSRIVFQQELVKSVKNGNHVEDFTYDANGMRVRKTADGAVTDCFYDGVNLLYEVTGGAGKNHVWANGTLLCTVQNNNYTYYHTDHLGTSKLQTDGQGKVVSIDITKPYGPVAREGVMADTFSDLSKIDPDKSRFQYDAATGTILPPVRGRGLPKQIMDNHEVTVEKTNYERVKNARIIQTASDQVNTELKIEFDFVGKARLTVKNKAGDIVFQDEYSGTELKSKTIRVEVGYVLNQAYTVILELAARNASTPARSTIFSVSWGEAEADYGFVRSLPVTFAIEVYAVKLNLAGTGVTFYLNTGGKLWQRIEPGKETLLDQPGRTLTIRAYLTLDEGTNLQSYGLEINPYHDMSFTGKFLEPEIGLVYFGGRWYEPGVGRWVTVDPAEDGENWYEYCNGNPIYAIDPDGRITFFLNGIGNDRGITKEAEKLRDDQRFGGKIHPIATFENSKNYAGDAGKCIDMLFGYDAGEVGKAYRKILNVLYSMDVFCRIIYKNETINFIGYSGGAIISNRVIMKLKKEPVFANRIKNFVNIGNGAWQLPNNMVVNNVLIYGSSDILVGGGQYKEVYAFSHGWDYVKKLPGAKHSGEQGYFYRHYEETVKVLLRYVE